MSRAAFHARLLSGSARRVEAQELRAAYFTTHPDSGDGVRDRADLLALLHEFHDEGLLRLPAQGGDGWDRATRPPFPRFVTLVRGRSPRDRPWQRELWRPELAWVRDLATLGDEQHAFLRRVNEGLARGAFRQPAPVKRRSLELTGLEKRLEELARTRLFGPGKLSFELLGCELMPYLTVERVGPGDVALLFENKDPFVLALMTLEHTGSPYGLVAYGVGNAGPRNVAHLLGRGARAVAYVGDLDEAGLVIGARVRSASERAGLAFAPATRLHSRMLAVARVWQRPIEPQLVPPQALAWLDPAFAPLVQKALASGLRASEECLGAEDLLSAAQGASAEG